jgi:hypothetical protein
MTADEIRDCLERIEKIEERVARLETCGRSAEEFENPLDDPAYQEFLVETAKSCHADNPPCEGCCAGGLCDGSSDHSPSDLDGEQDEEMKS